MKLLITGSAGQVGSALCALAEAGNIDYQAYSSAELDITRESKVLRVMRRNRPTCVINAAAYTAVDQAEDEADHCFAVNRDGARYLAKACSRYGASLLQISTSYVFDGKKKSGYVEEDIANPINCYGASKLAGEQEIAKLLNRYAILRVSWVFGEVGNNFVKTIARVCQEREELSIVDDQIGAPTSATDVARVLIAMAQQYDCGSKAWGTYHYASEGATNWHDFAEQIVAETSKYTPVNVTQVKAVKTTEYDYRAARPLNSQLNCQKILEAFGIKQRSWRPEMAKVVKYCCQSNLNLSE